MSTLNWNNFDGLQFQKLCNSLLLFNVSKFAHVFTAPGSDAGIDQLFVGSYETKIGKWRFQDKFHNSGTKSADVAALKKDILKDIETNCKDENFIVLITNVNLTVAKYNELLTAAKNLLGKLKIKECEFILWHEATIESLLSNYPVIYNWFWEIESVLLQPYELYFSNQLREDTHDLRNQLKNTFIGRETQLSELDAFIQDSSKSALAVIANGGYGKTRLLVEYIKNDLAKKEEWIPLVMSHTGFNPTLFSHLLKTKRKLLIFIDNAHEIPAIVSEVKRLIDNTHGKDKLILTTRPTLFSEILDKLPSHGKSIEKLSLPKLPYEQTKEMFKKELPGLKNRQLLHLTDLSKGVPNVILELIRLVRLGKQPNEISVEETFNQSVKEIFAEAIKDIEAKTLITKDKIGDFLRLIALISPVNNNNVDKEFVSGFLDLRIDKLELLINELFALNLLDAEQTISIKPDPYSDTILAETIQKNKTFIELVRNYTGAERYLENILKNLSEAEIVKDEREYFIDGLLLGYVSLLRDSSTSCKKIKNIFEFVEKIAVYKPKYGVFVINEFLAFDINKAHPVHTEMDSWTGKTFFTTISELTAKILETLSSYSKYARDNKEEIHKLIEGYIKATGDLKILGLCYCYHEWDFIYFGYRPRQCCERQTFLKSIICNGLKSEDDIAKITIALSSASLLLQLDFQLERYFEPATMQMHFGEGPVPYCKHVEQIRTEILEAIFIFLNKNTIEESNEKALGFLLNYFFYSCKNFSKRHKQDLSKEIRIVLPFLNTYLDKNIGTSQKNKILSAIQRYERAEFQEEFQETISGLKTKAGYSNSLYEELEMNLINEDYFDMKNNLEPRIEKLITQYGSFKQFEKDLIKIRLALNKTPSYFQGVLAIINKKYPTEARDFFEEFKTKYPELISEGVSLIGEQYKDEEYFYNILKWLWARKDIHLNTFFWLLSWGRNRDRKYYKKEDLDYYEFLISNNVDNPSLHDFVSYNLIDYAYLDKERTFSLLDKFLKVLHSRSWSHLSYTMFDKKENYSNDFKEEIKNLFFSNVDRIDIEEFLSNQFLQFLEGNFGFDELYQFINKLIEEALKKEGYHYFHFDRNFYRNNSLTIEEKIERFIKVLEWYIRDYDTNSRKQDYIVEIFRPDVFLTSEIRKAIDTLIDKYKNDSSVLTILANAFQFFANTTEEWIYTIGSIADLLVAQSKSEVDFHKVFGSSFYDNMGGKSKSGKGVPYDEDKAKEELLEKVISENKLSAPVNQYLEKCLKKVKMDITREIESDEKELKW